MLRLFVLSLCVCLTLSACAPTTFTRGRFINEADLAKLQPGAVRKIDVLNLIGSPSTQSTFEQDVWYYVGQRTEKSSFALEKVVQQQVLGLSFDEDERLIALVLRGTDDYRDVTPVSRATPTSGKELTILEQLVGNVGRFNQRPGLGEE